ncbi:MAG: hypothetical protein ABIH82_05305 [Candidatus Woesearchaeota archaeon]
MKYKHLFWLILLLLVAGTAMAQTDKVMVVTYDSTEDMLIDLGKVQTTLEKPQQQPLKTWTYCHRYNCIQVPVLNQIESPVFNPIEMPMVTQVMPVFTHIHLEPVNKYHYNSVDGQYFDDWDNKNDYYKHKYDKNKKLNYRRYWN